MFRILQLLFTTILFSSLLNAVEYRLELKKGWQLIGLPSDIDNMRIFNNDNVRLVWHYDGEYSEWLGYSPDNDIDDKLDNLNITPLTSVKRWHGIWVYSYEDWEVAVDDNTELYVNSKDIGKIDIFKGWNLISLPYKTVLSPEIFSGLKVWKYSDEKEWQTNTKYSFLDFPEIDEINTKMGFWIYTPVDKTLNLPELSGELSSPSTLTEMKNRVTNSLIIGERKDNFWGWVEKRSRYETETEETATEETETTNNALLNEFEPEVEASSTIFPKRLVATDDYLYALSVDQKKIEQRVLESVLFEGSSKINAETPSINLKNGNTDEIYPSSVNSFYVTNNGERIISISDMEYSGESFAGRCREDRTFISIYDFDNDDTAQLRRHILFDGTLYDSRMVGNQLYLFFDFQPCIDIDYPKEYLSDIDECRYPQDTVEYQHLCYDVLEDEENEKLFRYNYEEPTINNLYYEPRYQYIDQNFSRALLDPQDFLSLNRLDQKGSFFTVISLNTVTGIVNDKISVFGEIAEKHISQNSFYLTYKLSPVHISFEEYRGRTRIEKFNFYPNLEHRASTFIDGEPLNRFSLDEYDKVLRVVTTDKLSWAEDSDEVGNRVEAFVEQTGGVLARVGGLENFVSYFKKVESVKFFKDLAITSVKGDKRLYLTNMSDETTPVRAGEITPNGRIELIKYVPESSTLLTFGVDQSEIALDQGVRLDSFDLSNLKDPEIVSSRVIGDYYNSSPVFMNSEALKYDNENGIISFPISGGESVSSADSGIYSYSVSEDGVITQNKMLSSATISNERIGDAIFVEANNQLFSVYVANGKIYTVKVEK
jgi:hypothetical protein